jgi:hypothetical protein
MLHLIYKNGYDLCVCVCVCVCKLDSHEENFTACCCFLGLQKVVKVNFFWLFS